MTPEEYAKMFFIFAVILGLGVLVFVIGRFSGDKNNLDGLQSSLGIVFGVTIAVLTVIAVITYYYLRTNPQAFVPLTIILMFLNMQFALTAVGVSVIQKT